MLKHSKKTDLFIVFALILVLLPSVAAQRLKGGGEVDSIYRVRDLKGRDAKLNLTDDTFAFTRLQLIPRTTVSGPDTQLGVRSKRAEMSAAQTPSLAFHEHRSYIET